MSAEQLQASYQRARSRARGSEAAATELKVALRSQGSAPVTRLQLQAATERRALGERVLPVRADDCAALPDTLALVLLLLSQSAGPEPAPPPPMAAEPMVDSELPWQRRSMPVEPPAGDPVFGLGVGAGAMLGTLGRAALQLQLVAALRTPILDGRVRAAVLWPQAFAVAEGRVTMASYELALEACPKWRAAEQPKIELRLRIGPRAGVIRAESRGFLVQNRTRNELLVYASVAPEAAVSLGPSTWLELGAGIALALQRPRFLLQFAEQKPDLELAGPAPVRGEFALTVVQMF